MQSKSISENCTAIALGMGLGEFEALKLEEILKSKSYKSKHRHALKCNKRHLSTLFCSFF